MLKDHRSFSGRNNYYNALSSFLDYDTMTATWHQYKYVHVNVDAAL
jgi:hypothetical protein